MKKSDVRRLIFNSQEYIGPLEWEYFKEIWDHEKDKLEKRKEKGFRKNLRLIKRIN